MAKGVCKLTGKTGKYVNSHIIPKALTKPEVRGEPLIQAGIGTRPERRWSSWYDSQLVTREGEDILSDLDDWAIKELRRLKLIWSGWGPMTRLSDAELEGIPGTQWSIRHVEPSDVRRLRLFFLSLLWRAGESRRKEFELITLPPDDAETIRSAIVTSDVPPVEFYAVSLIQLSTLGAVHNHTPTAEMMKTPALEGVEEREVPIFRFYFDGLIAHIKRRPFDELKDDATSPTIVGAQNRLLVLATPFETSRQRDLLAYVMREALAYDARKSPRTT